MPTYFTVQLMVSISQASRVDYIAEQGSFIVALKFTYGGHGSGFMYKFSETDSLTDKPEVSENTTMG